MVPCIERGRSIRFNIPRYGGWSRGQQHLSARGGLGFGDAGSAGIAVRATIVSIADGLKMNESRNGSL